MSLPGLPAPAMLKKAVSSETRAACCMLWVTMTIVYSAFSSWIRSSTAEVEIGSREEHGSAISSNSRPAARAAGDAEALLLATGEAHPRLVQSVLHLVPQVRTAQRLLDHVVRGGPREPLVVQPQPREDVLVDRHRGDRGGA